jgi:hypothetical protein
MFRLLDVFMKASFSAARNSPATRGNLKTAAALRNSSAVLGDAALHGGSAPPTPNLTSASQFAELDAHN